MTQRVMLIACSKAKLPHEALAKDLYQGDLFKKARALAELRGARWFVLSAKLGVVAPNTVIFPYDDTLASKSRSARHSWGNKVLYHLRMLNLLGEQLEVLAGRLYRTSGNWTAGLDVTVPMRGMGIGQQKAWLAEQLRVEQLPIPRK